MCMRVRINQNKNLRIIGSVQVFVKFCITIGVEMNEIIRCLNRIHKLEKTFDPYKIKPFLNNKIIIQ